MNWGPLGTWDQPQMNVDTRGCIYTESPKQEIELRTALLTVNERQLMPICKESETLFS